MSFIPQDIITTASLTLQDETNIRWTVYELTGYLNDGIRALIVVRPDASAKMAPTVTVAGARQPLPAEAVAFMDVYGNTNGTLRAITKIDINTMSAFSRDWQSGVQSAVALHFMYDQREPRYFYVYPPSNGSGSVDLLYSVFPPPVHPSALSTAVDMNKQWQNPLLNFVLGRAYDKDAEYGGNQQASATYMGRYSQEIGEQLQSSSAVTPKA